MGAPSPATTPTPKIFIDGEAGTTGLQIRERLEASGDLALLTIDPAQRKDPDARKALMAQAQIVVLCLPDDAAREAVALADTLGDDAPRIVDASTAHRVADGWIYGFAELSETQAARVMTATRVANPGCYPTGALALLRPLIDAGALPTEALITINAVSGYSGGGRTMIETFERGEGPAFELYGLQLRHKHLPEIHRYSGLVHRPIFVPSVGTFRQGMLVSIPLHLASLPTQPTLDDLRAIYARAFAGSSWVKPGVMDGPAATGRIEPQGLNDSDAMEVFVFGDDALGQAVLVARLDNLGKGAAGAAVQNIRLMAGLAV
ncbi:MAG: N-acetyl-gamma-glutamyl-phosphate reductase [Pseudomonadota bacterium]